MTWAAIPGFDPFQVNEDGEVRRPGRVGLVNGRPVGKPPKLVAQAVNEDGYREVRLHGRRALVHVLVARAFLGPPPSPKHVVDHKNGLRSDARLSNLRYLTGTENTQAGLSAKLDHRRAERIRRRYGKETQADIAAAEGVSQQTVSRVVRGKAWKDGTRADGAGGDQ